MRDVEITQQPVELYKLLKFEGLVGSGGDAKTVISDGMVSVNGVIETQKRKKLVSGDVVTFGYESLKLKLVEAGETTSGAASGHDENSPVSPKGSARPVRRGKPPVVRSK